MASFQTMALPQLPDVMAPDGSQVRILLQTQRGSMAHFRLEPGQTSRPVAHRRVEELWYVVSGQGEMWRRQGDRAEVVQLDAGSCVSIPAGTAFQFRSTSHEPFCAVAVTMPPWPGEYEAFAVEGPWQPQVEGR